MSFDTGVCWGFFSVVQKTTELPMWRADSGTIPTACIPEDARRVQLIKVFVQFMDKHPEQLHKSPIEMTRRALADAFPCKPTKSPNGRPR